MRTAATDTAASVVTAIPPGVRTYTVHNSQLRNRLGRLFTYVSKICNHVLDRYVLSGDPPTSRKMGG